MINCNHIKKIPWRPNGRRRKQGGYIVMDFSESRIADFSAALASAAPTPGGGGAAALMGSLAAALCTMAGNLTVGKKRYTERETALRRIIEEAEALRLRFLALIGEDAEAFKPLAAAYALPKDAPDRAGILRRASLDACAAPLEMLRCCCAAIRLLEEMKDICSPLMISDVGCATAAAKAALDAAALNVFVNTRGFGGDREAMAAEDEAAALCREYGPRAQAVTDGIGERLRRKKDG